MRGSYHAPLIAALLQTGGDRPGKRAYLRFHVAEVAAPFLTEALAQLRTLTPHAAVTSFHAQTLAVVGDEQAAVAAMAAALDPPAPDVFARAHAQLMDVQPRVVRWEDFRRRVLRDHGVTLAPPATVRLPEASGVR